MKQKLLSLCPIADKEVEAIIAKFYDIDVMAEPTEEKVLAAIEPYAAVIVPYTAPMLISERVIDAAKNLKLIASTYGGTRQNIADIYALERGITIIHTGASRERPMAEYTLGLVLSSFLRIHNYHHDMVSGEAWPRFKYPRTRIVNNRKVAVVGYGRIGKAIVNLFKCFTDKISVVSRHLSAEDAAKDGVSVVSLNEAFANNEVIILAGGHNSETDKLIKREQFELMADNALFVNIARGKMVDEQAMAEVAAAKNIFLALDVFETEPLPEDSILRRNERVLLTPHRANNSIEFEERWKCLGSDIELFCTGKTPESALTVARAKVMSES
ncbi:MAG: glyoxylate reductase [Lentisphaeria bacterium]|nr:glyoxylate reductase [Lentisphaeria bacterium]MBQ7396949.1 glyoxylate reductase [Lentisphaeria bacterium]MBR7120061.1 glyoxylate reductase [Lentisphaeria bacterium]